MATKLSPHFTLEELTHTDTGIENKPDWAMQARLSHTALFMEEVRRIVGNKPIHVHNGWRSPALNKAVGGVPNSAHLSGWAVDFDVEGQTPYQTACLIRDSGLKYDQLIHEKREWVHISCDPKLRQQDLTLPVKKGASYVPGILK